MARMPDMQALARSAVTALQRATLFDEAQDVQVRVLTRSPEELLERSTVESLVVWHFKPMVELLLHELRHVATAPGLSLEARRERIKWTLDAAGF